MAQHQDMWPVAVLCEVWGVSRRGFYTYMQRQASPTSERDELEELARVKAIAAETGYSYGSRRMAKQLQAAGFAVGRHTARQLMRQAGMVGRRRTRRRPVTTDSRHGYHVAPNLLVRQCAVDHPDHVWAGDITYVWTAEGWLYVAVLVDLYVQKGIGKGGGIDRSVLISLPTDLCAPRKRQCIDVAHVEGYYGSTPYSGLEIRR